MLFIWFSAQYNLMAALLIVRLKALIVQGDRLLATRTEELFSLKQ